MATTDLNLAGESYAHSLIAAGKVNRSASWSFDDATDGSALLGKAGDDWTNYGRHHLGLNRAASEKTKGRYKYPFAKAGVLYRSGLTAIRQRAAQQSDAAIERAAGELLDLVDRPKGVAAAYDRKSVAFAYKFSATEAGTFEGYGSVFNNEDAYGDVILPGSFVKTLAEHQQRGKLPKMLINHGSMGGGLFGGADPMADVPIGKWTAMSEDSHGLHVKGHLINLDTERGKTIHGAMKAEELDGLSIGYRATDFVRGTKENEPRRTIKEIKLFEVSPVTFPANDQALVSSVKAGRIGTIREFEAFLRNAGGFSHAAARSIAEGGFKSSSEPRDEDGVSDLLRTLRRARAGLSTSS